MTKLWLLLLLPYTVLAGKITKEENEMLKIKCSLKASVLSRVKRRQPASSYEYPFAAALCIRRIVPGGEIEEHSLPTCSGVLISPRHILTSAVCLYMDYQRSCTHGLRPPKLSAENIGVLLSSRCTNSECWFNEKMLRPTSVVMHPSYEDCMRDGSYDLAVIELDKDVRTAPICMPGAYSAISRPENLRYIGYGEVDEHQGLQSLWYRYILEEGRTIFAYNMTMKTDHGAEDNGGPLVQKMEGKHYLFGIHAGYGYRVHNSGGRQIPVAEGAVFADVRKQLTWICDVTGVCSL
ncbi:unnamed protein product [Cylicocyclus nassatus]|uniref:Peptidase S1 domain-containing protein n=1 Tax=Cylicocyclus nassatus TaxID=53992 RepID=A0AA36HG54_CYLNA|nr:unnamed protein product [Cylicocyclus nassatus]